MSKWNENETTKALELIRNGKTYKEISKVLNRSEGSIRNKVNEFGESSRKYYDKNITREIKKCLYCEEDFECLKKDERIFCSHSCTAKYNNLKRGFKSKIKLEKCKNCNDKLKVHTYIFCSNKCQGQFQTKETFKEIENGNLNYYHDTYKKYLIFKYGAKCMECRWNEINPITGLVPIQLEHIDGNSENNSLDNLKLLCPNCHSLTPTYGALNKGNGRKNRKR